MHGSKETNPELFYQFIKNFNEVKNCNYNKKIEKPFETKIEKILKENKTNDILDQEITLEETEKILKKW